MREEKSCDYLRKVERLQNLTDASTSACVVRRFNGPWLLSHWDGDDDPGWLREGEEDENKHVRNSIIMASHDFMTYVSATRRDAMRCDAMRCDAMIVKKEQADEGTESVTLM